jgi:hypothetical protein
MTRNAGSLSDDRGTLKTCIVQLRERLGVIPPDAKRAMLEDLTTREIQPLTRTSEALSKKQRRHRRVKPRSEH